MKNFSLAALCVFGLFSAQLTMAQVSSAPPVAGEPLVLSLEDCLQIALEKNHQRPISRMEQQIAEEQYRQALSLWWPQITASGSYTLFDEDPTFGMPSSSIQMAGSAISIPAQSFTLPAGAFGGGLPTQDVQISTSAGTMEIEGRTINLDAQTLKAADKQTISGSISALYPLYTGGMRPAVIRMAKAGMTAAGEEARKTDLQVVYDIKKLYWADVMAQRILKIGRDTIDKMKVTQDVTERMYQTGSGKVKKTDYLRAKMSVEGLRTLVIELETNEQAIRSALINTLGLDYDTSIVLSAQELPIPTADLKLPDMMDGAFEFNPDWRKIAAGLDAAQAQVKQAKSGYKPKVALMGSLTKIDNDYNYGYMTEGNKQGWMVGVGVEIPLFRGFRTKHEIKEAKLRLSKMERTRLMLKDAIALQVKIVFRQLAGAMERRASSLASMNAAVEFCELNSRAYQDELVETKDVIESQMMEAFMMAQYQRTLYEYVAAQAQLDFVVGAEVMKLLDLAEPEPATVEGQ